MRGEKRISYKPKKPSVNTLSEKLVRQFVRPLCYVDWLSSPRRYNVGLFRGYCNLHLGIVVADLFLLKVLIDCLCDGN